MTGNIIGERFVVSTFGESHGKCIGVLIDGCPAGLKLDESDIQPFLNLRKPGQSTITTQRKEDDEVEIISGTFNNCTTGAPICMLIWNKDQDSRSYESVKSIPRPGHSDYTSFVKYGGYADYRGSGRFSGRLTATFVMAGAVAKKLLQQELGIETIAYTIEIGGIKSRNISFDEAKDNIYNNDVRCPDKEKSQEMRNAILNAKRKGDSLGGIVESVSINVPVGLGEPLFCSLESDISRALFSIPAVKGVEFGSGFDGSRKTGSENNDVFIKSSSGKIITKTNNSGGILGGISNGMPIITRTGFKPAASIAKKQHTLDLATDQETDLIVSGRHDPCVVPRAPPVIESVISIILADHAIRNGTILPVLNIKKLGDK